MCGIIGYAGRDAAHAVDEITDGVRRLVHRGPDASGLSQFDGCVLGHTRLRVIDTRASADQPMTLAHAGLSIVFNGEVYNFQELRAELRSAGHRFTTNSDTEVILHLYEEDAARFVERLEGMFAFALWDERRARLVLARDRLGIKPLYYRLTGEAIAFASEVDCLTTARSELRPSAVAGYLRMGWVAGPETILSDVYELPPGRRLVWEGGRSSVTRYWSGPRPTDQVPSAEDLSRAVRDAVRRQMVADVPLGLFLSAGVDSVVLARLAAQEHPGVRAFTVAFDTGPDEAADASMLARRLRLDHAIVPVSSAAVLADLDAIIRHMGQPTVDGVNSWVISRAVREAGLVVALSGLGGDELFQGYSTFRHVPRIARLGGLARHIPGPLSASAVRALAHLPAVAGSRALRASEAALHGGHRAAYAAVRGLFSVRDLERLWPDIRSVSDPVDAMLHDGHLPSGVGRVSTLELANYLPFQLLRDTDAMSMAHALEVRVPLLDERVVDVVLRRQCAPSRRATATPPFDKRALVDAVDARLEAVARRPKRTFTLPFDAWLRGALRDRVHESVLGLADTGIGFDRAALARVCRRFDEGRLGWRPVWALAVLGEWVAAHHAADPRGRRPAEVAAA